MIGRIEMFGCLADCWCVGDHGFCYLFVFKTCVIGNNTYVIECCAFCALGGVVLQFCGG